MGLLITAPNQINEHLLGSDLPDIMKKFQAQVVGKTVKEAGYLVEEEDEIVVPVLIMDDDTIIMASSDDEFNDGGVLMAKPKDDKAPGSSLCQAMMNHHAQQADL